MNEDRAWFEYRRSPGRFTAKPVGVVGWIVFLVVMPLPSLLMIAMGPIAYRIHPLLFAALLLTVLGLFFMGLFRLVRAKGRPAR